jgi:hypothetical protein
VPATLKSTRKPAREGLNERVLFPQRLARRAAVAPRPHDSSAESKFRLFGSRLGPAEAQSNAWAPRPALSVVAAWAEKWTFAQLREGRCARLDACGASARAAAAPMATAVRPAAAVCLTAELWLRGDGRIGTGLRVGVGRPHALSVQAGFSLSLRGCGRLFSLRRGFMRSNNFWRTWSIAAVRDPSASIMMIDFCSEEALLRDLRSTKEVPMNEQAHRSLKAFIDRRKAEEKVRLAVEDLVESSTEAAPAFRANR